MKKWLQFFMALICIGFLGITAYAAEDSSVDTDSEMEVATDEAIEVTTPPALEFDDENRILDIQFSDTGKTPHQKTYVRSELLSYKITLGDEVETKRFKYIKLVFTSDTGKTVELLSSMAPNGKYFRYYGRYGTYSVSSTNLPTGEYTLTDVEFLDSNKNKLSNLGIDTRAVLKDTTHVVKFTVVANQSTVKIEKPSSLTSVAIGKTILLTPSIDGKIYDIQDFDWYTSDKDIASLAGPGQIKSVSRGKATIKAVLKTDDSVYGYINLPCYTYISKISLNYNTADIKVGKTLTLKATINSTADYPTLLWSSADPTIAAVSSKGVVTGKSYGTTVITASANDGSNKKVECIVVVADMIIVLDPGHGGTDPGAVGNGLKERDVNYKIAKYLKTELEEYYGVKVYMTHNTFSGYQLDLQTRVFRAKNYKGDLLVSLHNNAGSSTAKGAEVIISRYTGSSRFNKNLNTLGNYILDEITKLGIKRRSVYSRVTTTSNKYSNGQKQDYYGIIRHGVLYNVPSLIIEHAFISSSDYKYLNSNTKLKKLAVADAKGIAKFYKLISTDDYIALQSVSLNKKSALLKVGEKVTLTTKATPARATVKSTTWTSSNKAVATVSAKGVITTKAVGTATIIANMDGKETTCKVTVAKTIPVKGITLTRPSSSLSLNHKFQLTTTFSPSNASNQKYKFTSSNDKIATVNSKGVVTGKKEGTVKITVKSTDGEFTSSVNVTIKKVKVKSIKAKVSSAKVSIGGTRKITTTISPSNASYKGVKYKSSNTKVATVTSTGVIKAKKKGTATITVLATDGSKVTQKIKITVK